MIFFLILGYLDFAFWVLLFVFYVFKLLSLSKISYFKQKQGVVKQEKIGVIIYSTTFVVVVDCKFISHAFHTGLFTFNRFTIFRLLKPAGFKCD